MFAFEAVKSENCVKHFFFFLEKKEGEQLKGTVAFFFLISLVHLASGVSSRLT